jgi:hypothetical protein
MKAHHTPPVAWLPVTCALTLAGCVGWGPYESPAPLSESRGVPYRLRGTMTDGRRVELTSPFVRTDTLFGRTGPPRDTVALAVSDVRGLERERLDIWRTLGLTVAPVAALFAVVAIGCSIDDCGPQPTR